MSTSNQVTMPHSPHDLLPTPAMPSTPNDETSIDYSQPLSSLLKVATARAHENVENSAGARALISGQLPLDDYAKYLFMLFHIYVTLEDALDQHSNHPSLAPTYNARLLARSEALSSDIASLLQTSSDPQSWQAHPLYQSFLPLPTPVTAYVARIQEIATSPDPTRLLAHSYVRYLGDLSGGQFIKRIVSKAYNLDESATSFYEFTRLGDTSSTANMGDMKKVKEWFREGMDAGVPDDQATKEAVIDEANRAFDFNNGLFQAIEVAIPPKVIKPLTSTTPGSKVVYEAPEEVDPAAGIPTFVMVVIAMAAAHFLLTVGGFTGSSGSEKLKGFFEAVDSYFHSIVGVNAAP